MSTDGNTLGDLAASGIGSIYNKASELGTGLVDATNKWAGKTFPDWNTDTGSQDVSSTESTKNINYVMRLYDINNSSLSIMANVPRSFDFQLQNSWTDVLSVIRDVAGSTGFGGSEVAALKGVQAFSGTVLLPQFLTLQCWQGTSSLEFQLPCQKSLLLL